MRGGGGGGRAAGWCSGDGATRGSGRSVTWGLFRLGEPRGEEGYCRFVGEVRRNVWRGRVFRE